MKDYANVLWRRRWLIVLGVLLSAGGAFVVSWLMPRTYEARVTVMVSESKIGQTGERPAVPVTVTAFRALLENNTLAARIVQEFKLGESPHRLSPTTFLRRSLRIEEVPRANLIRAYVTLKDPKLTAEVANRLADQALELNRQINQEETVSVRDFIKAQLDQSRIRMEETEQRLLAYKNDAQVELLRVDTETLLDQRGDLLRLLVQIEAEKGRVAKAEEELAKQDRILPVRRAVDTGEALFDAARRSQIPPPDGSKQTTNLKPEGTRGQVQAQESDRTTPQRPERRERPSNPETLPELGLDLRNEFLNPVYEVLEYQAATGRTKLAALDRQRQQLVSRLKLDGSQVGHLTELYKRETELAKLQLEYDLAKQLYSDLSKRYEQALIQVAGRSSQLQIIDRALIPEGPLSRHISRNAAIALLFGLAFSVIAAFCLEYLSTREPAAARRPF